MSLAISTIGPLSCTNLMQGYTKTVTAAGTTVLTTSSTQTQFFTGTTTQTVQLPAVGTLIAGYNYTIANKSTGVVTVQSSVPTTINTIASGAQFTYTCTDTTAATGVDGWSFVQSGYTTLDIVLDSNATPKYPQDLTKGMWYGLNTRANAFDSTCITIGGLSGVPQQTATTASNCIAVGIGARAQASGAIAFGASNTASGVDSIAIGNWTGRLNTATGQNAVALGMGAQASNTSASALGALATASGSQSMALGPSTTASGSNALHWGPNPAGGGATGNNSICLGVQTSRLAFATQTDSIAFGSGSQSTGVRSISIGAISAASAQDTFAVGNNSVASGVSSIAIGAGSTSRGTNCIGFGASARTGSGSDNLIIGGNAGLDTGIGNQNIGVGAGTLTTNYNGVSNVAVGNAGLSAVGSPQYSTGTASQSGTVITGVGTVFTQGMVGGTIVFANNAYNIITGYVSATQLTAQFAQTVAAQAFTVFYNKSGASVYGTASQSGTTLTMTSVGFLAIQSSYGDELIGAIIVFANGVQATITSVVDKYNQTFTATPSQTVANQAFQFVYPNGYNTAVGGGSQTAVSVGGFNTSLGYGTMLTSRYVDNSIAIGYEAMRNANSSYDIGIGWKALSNNTGNSNICIGSLSAERGTSLNSNVCIGAYTLNANINGLGNVAIGDSSILAATNSSNLVAIGASALVLVASNRMSQGNASQSGTTVSFTGVSLLNDFSITYPYRNIQNVGTGTIVYQNGVQAALSSTGPLYTTVASPSQTVASQPYNVYAGLLYAVGTASLSGNVVTPSGGAVFTPDMVDGFIIFSDGTNAQIGGYGADGTLSIQTPGTVATTTYRIHYGGGNNVGVGSSAASRLLYGYRNTAVGNKSQSTNMLGSNNTSVGTYSMLGSDVTSGGATRAAPQENTCIGSGALQFADSPQGNTAVGYNSLNRNTSASRNTAVGHRSLESNGNLWYKYSTISQSGNTITGVNTNFTSNMVGGTFVIGSGTNTHATITGWTSATQITVSNSQTVATTSGYSVFYGQQYAVGTASQSGFTVTGSGTTWNANMVGGVILFLGDYSANPLTITSVVSATSLTVNQSITFASQTYIIFTGGYENTALGYQSLRNNTFGIFNTGTGSFALTANTTGNFNVGEGAYTLTNNTTGNGNTGIGYQSMRLNTTGTNNVAVGNVALRTNSTGDDNVAVGTAALLNSTVSQLVAVGSAALQNNTTGIKNTAVGYGSLSFNTTGGENVAVGYQTGIAITTGSGNVLVGNSCSVDVSGRNNAVVLGNGITSISGAGAHDGGLYSQHYAASVTGNTAVFIGNEIIETTSSERYKENIRPLEDVSERVMKVEPVRYIGKGDPERREQLGLIAEKMVEIFPEVVTFKDFEVDGETKSLPNGIAYDRLVAVLFQQVKNLTRDLAAVQAELAQLKK